MPVAYVDQSASGLALNLIDGVVDVGEFNVFRAAAIDRRDVRVRAAIIGASHVLAFETPSAVLTEIFACMGARVGSNRILFGALNELLGTTRELTFSDGRRYRFSASLATDTAVQRLRARSARRELRLEFTFPEGPNGHAAPETIVTVTHARGSIVAETAHCYPGEGTIVVTSSTLTWDRA